MVERVVCYDEEESLGIYYKDVRKSVVLSQIDEIDTAKRIKRGDNRAIDRLVEANLKFVVLIAKEYQNQGLSLADLISEGNYGLVKAATRFDHTKGFRFISYAVWWIRQSIIQSLNENARMVRLPVNVINKLSSLKKEIEKFEIENEREPMYGEIVDENSDSVDLFFYPRCSSLNETINDDGDEMIDFVMEDNNEKSIPNENLKRRLNETLSILNERERVMVESYYGINREGEAMTLDAIGEIFSLSKERVRQIIARSIRKLRNNAHNLYSLKND
jgi:RNA polymerase primary sigma factor